MTLSVDTNPRAVIGDNAGPMTPFEIAQKAVEDIYFETVQWLDGKPIDSQELADGVANLLADIRKADKLAKAARKEEEDPHDNAVKEIRARYAPLIADTKAVRGKTVIASEACEAALQPWLLEKDRQIKEAARLAREAADRQRAEAEAALRASDAANIAEREAAERLLHDARKAETAANVAGRQTATAGGALGRAAHLTTKWIASIDDPVEAARACWADPTGHAEILECLVTWANRRVREGVRSIPGFDIFEKRSAV